MSEVTSKELRNILFTFASFILLLIISTIGYYLIAPDHPSLIDCLYMTTITITTIGYGEVFDVSSPTGRLFTIFVAFAGIGLMGYLLTQTSAYVIEGHLKMNLVNQRMERMVSKLDKHYIVCGYGRVGQAIINDLINQNLDFVLIDVEEESIEESRAKGYYVLKGDATDDDVLEKAGAHKALGIFAATGADNQNLVISLSAKLLNPNLRIASRCEDPNNLNKMKRAGAHIVISPTYIGGERMTNEMVHPQLTDFVTQLFFNHKHPRSVSSVMVGDVNNMTISGLDLKDLDETLILALQKAETQEILYNPSRDTPLLKGDQIIAMSCEKEIGELTKRLKGQHTQTI